MILFDPLDILLWILVRNDSLLFRKYQGCPQLTLCNNQDQNLNICLLVGLVLLSLGKIHHQDRRVIRKDCPIILLLGQILLEKDLCLNLLYQVVEFQIEELSMLKVTF